MNTRRLTLLLLLLAALVLPSQALGFANGQYPRSALAPISGGLDHSGKPQTAYLLKGRIAADFNTINLCATADGVPLTPGPSVYQPAATAYRSVRIQVILRRQLGTDAAVPGTSNHGTGRAWDARALQMRTWIDHHGARFGISKRTSDASWEWWHLLVRPELVGFDRPDPGTSVRFPNLRVGSGGPCQAPAVREVQRRLGIARDGEYGRKTKRRVKQFERKYHLHVDGRVTSKDWLKMRKVGRDLAANRDPRTVGSLPGSNAPMAGQDVRAVQGFLNARFKELHHPEYRIKVDGVTDARFTLAVKRFQRLANKHGAHLKVTGRVDDETYARLIKTFVKPTQVLRITGEGAGLVARSEGFRSCPYRDAVGVWTIAFGHTSAPGTPPRHVNSATRCVTVKKGLKILTVDLDHFALGVTKLIKVRVGSRQYNAIVSWAFNVGLGAAAESTLIHKLNEHHYAQAANQFKRWNRAGGRVLPGLTVRRRAECKLFEKGSTRHAKRRIHC